MPKKPDQISSTKAANREPRRYSFVGGSRYNPSPTGQLTLPTTTTTVIDSTLQPRRNDDNLKLVVFRPQRPLYYCRRQSSPFPLQSAFTQSRNDNFSAWIDVL